MKYCAASEPPLASRPQRERQPRTKGLACSSGLNDAIAEDWHTPGPRMEKSRVHPKSVSGAKATRSRAEKLVGHAVTSFTVPASERKFHFVAPARPRLVVIWITPLAAAVP